MQEHNQTDRRQGFVAYTVNNMVTPAKHIFPIMEGSGFKLINKIQKKGFQKGQHLFVQGPYIKSKLSHTPITFTQDNLLLRDYPHNDTLVISCNIKGFIVQNVLVDNISAVDIIFSKAIKQMQNHRKIYCKRQQIHYLASREGR